jgi:hypothetical protein
MSTTTNAASVAQNYANEFQRSNITAADADAGTLPVVSLSPGLTFRLGASCDRPNATLALRLYFLDSQSRAIGVQPITFTTSAAADWGPTFNGTPSSESWWSIGAAKSLVIKADSVSPGSTWSVAGAWSP